ncbi:MAG: nucleotidyltransferase domain-containing protein [Anaeromyxobacter sp.]
MTRTNLAALGLPAEAARALETLRDALTGALGPDLCALVLYGGAARGSYRPGQSDLNIAVVLADGSAATLDRIAPALRAAYRAARVEPFLLTLAELPRLVECFPSKLLDLEANHVVLAGANPFAGLSASPALVRLRAEQALRNLALRLRRRYVSAADDPAALLAVLRDVARPLAAELTVLLQAHGAPPATEQTAALLEAAAAALGLDAEALRALARLRKGEEPGLPPAALYARVLGAAEEGARAAAALRSQP